MDHFCLYDEKDREEEGGCSILFDHLEARGCFLLDLI